LEYKNRHEPAYAGGAFFAPFLRKQEFFHKLAAARFLRRSCASRNSSELGGFHI
jgi:hypothetical protein